MEIDVKHTKQRNKRRERAQRMQAERDKDADGVGVGVIADCDSADEDSKKPIRPPQRRKKANTFKEPSPILEEEVVDGFAILSFKTYEDLEVRRVNNVTDGVNRLDSMARKRLIDISVKIDVETNSQSYEKLKRLVRVLLIGMICCWTVR